MSFGIKALKRADKNQWTGDNRLHIPTVILGDDLAAVLKLVELKKTHGPEKLRLITPRLMNRDYLISTYENTVSTLRDNVATLAIGQKFPHVRSTRVEEESLFYKEGQWQKFGGRAKSMELAHGENYFLSPRQDLSIASLFSEADWNELDQILNTYQNVRVLETFEKKTPQDLVNKDEWWLLFHDLGEVTCEELWLSLPSRLVMKASQHGQTLPTEMAGHFASIKRQAAVSLSWEMNKEIYPEMKTLFIPQSMTHEWGHFILDIRGWNEERKCHQVSALILLQEEEPTSEFMADKIKLAKRVLDRVFSNFESFVTKEHIHASEDYFEWPGDAKSAEEVMVAVPSLHLLGSYSYGSEAHKFMARSLLNL